MKKFISEIKVLIQYDNIEDAESYLRMDLAECLGIQGFTITEIRETDETLQKDRDLIDSVAFSSAHTIYTGNIDPIMAQAITPFFNRSLPGIPIDNAAEEMQKIQSNQQQTWESLEEHRARLIFQALGLVNSGHAFLLTPEQRHAWDESKNNNTMSETREATRTEHNNDIYWELVIDGYVIHWQGYNDKEWFDIHSKQDAVRYKKDKSGNTWDMDFSTGIAINLGKLGN